MQFSSNPADYIFDISIGVPSDLPPNAVMVNICNKSYFSKYKALNDIEISSIIQLPHYLEEVGEAVFISYKDEKTTEKDLLSLGLTKDAAFTQFLSSV